MSKIVYICFFFIIITNCSLNQNSKFWTSQDIKEEKNLNFKEIFATEDSLASEFNSDLLIRLNSNINNNLTIRDYFNNDGRLNYDGELKKSSRYKFSKIKNFYQFEPEISFDDKDILRHVEPTLDSKAVVTINGKQVEIGDAPVEIVLSRQVATITKDTYAIQEIDISKTKHTHTDTIQVELKHEELDVKEEGLLEHENQHTLKK